MPSPWELLRNYFTLVSLSALVTTSYFDIVAVKCTFSCRDKVCFGVCGRTSGLDVRLVYADVFNLMRQVKLVFCGIMLWYKF